MKVTSERIEEILESQKKYFRSGATLPVEFRIRMLKKLYQAVQKYEAEIAEALKKDLGIPLFTLPPAKWASVV